MTFDLNAGLSGARVLLTGAAGGIGREIARAFADRGARVACLDREQGALDALVAQLPGGPHLRFAWDLRDVPRHGDLIAQTVAALGGIDVLVQTAAVLVRRPSVFDVTEADWDIQAQVNLKACFFLSQAAARAMRDQGAGGRIIHFTSQGWMSGGFGGSVAYAATKGGIVSMTRGLARSLAPYGITVNAVSPGAADTAMMRSGMDEAAIKAVEAQIPLGRMARPDQIAGAVLFLASVGADYVTGATINVSGGWLMY
jgi:NAD(P)-dependent dehydrogenase (short-subunit alcohol dehydrogenase family)